MSELYQLPNGWEWVKLKDVCDLLNGYAFKAKEYIEHSDTVIIRMGNIRPNGGFDAEHKIKYLPNKYKDELQNYILNDGDLIIAMTDLATEMRILGNPTLVSNTNGRTFMLNQRVGKLHKFNFEKIIIEYLRYILSANQIKDYYKSLGGGGLQINIGKQQILSVDFPLPPLSEQQRIVSKLDLLFEKIDKSIALHQKNIDESDVFIGSVLNDVFGELEEKYEKKQLGDITTIIGGGTPKRNMNEYWDGGDIVWLSPTDLGKIGKIGEVSNSKDKITQLGLDKSSAKLLPIGTVLYSSRATIGKISINTIEVTTNQGFSNFVCKNDLYNRFLAYSLSKYTDNIVELSNSTTFKEVSKTNLKTFTIPTPPLNIQQKVVKYLDEVSQNLEKIKSIQKEKMDSLKALKASILDKAFRGEL